MIHSGMTRLRQSSRNVCKWLAIARFAVRSFLDDKSDNVSVVIVGGFYQHIRRRHKLRNAYEIRPVIFKHIYSFLLVPGDGIQKLETQRTTEKILREAVGHMGRQAICASMTEDAHTRGNELKADQSLNGPLRVSTALSIHQPLLLCGLYQRMLPIQEAI